VKDLRPCQVWLVLKDHIDGRRDDDGGNLGKQATTSSSPANSQGLPRLKLGLKISWFRTTLPKAILSGRTRNQGVAESTSSAELPTWALGSDTPAKSTLDYSSHQAEEMIRQSPDFALTVG
jgi:hypothetical protein